MLGDLLKAIAELRQSGDAEALRRQQLEGALQEAKALFKRELAAKNEELADVHAELGYVGSGQSLPQQQHSATSLEKPLLLMVLKRHETAYY